MSRRTIVMPEQLRRARRDPRFLAALRERGSEPAIEPGWRAQGRCLEVDPEVFFPLESPTEAVAICHSCSVRGACLAAALDAGEVDGVWGATTPDERRAMRLLWNAPRRRTPVVAR